MMVRFALPRRRRLARSRRDERNASGRQRCRAAGGEECAFEKAAPFGIEIVEQLLAVELELRAIAIVTCTHRMVSRKVVQNPACESEGPAGVMQQPCQSPICADTLDVRVSRPGEHRGLRKARCVNRLICSMHHQPAAETAEILCTTADLFPEARLRLQAGRR